jgi:hypothetical protein
MDLRQGRPQQADLAQIQTMTLHPPPTLEVLVVDDAQIAVRLVVLLSPGLPQEHDRASLAKRIRPGEQDRSSLQLFSAVEVEYSHVIFKYLLNHTRTKAGLFGVESAKTD